MEAIMFATTRWSLIVAGQDRQGPQAKAALAELCGIYWYPIYVFIRQRGESHDEAQDLTQSFFAHLLEKDTLASVDQARGRFRSFLLAACQHFLANERDRAHALKRGGGRHILSLNFVDAQRRYHQEPAHTDTPQRQFERCWALALLDRVLVRLQGELLAANKGQLFEVLRAHLTADDAGHSHAREAAELGLSEGAVKVAVHRLRRRYRELLREEIAQTVESPDQVEDEIQALFRAVSL
jgi:RNA polymerase sigma-70 factor (ECF subfamily)